MRTNLSRLVCLLLAAAASTHCAVIHRMDGVSLARELQRTGVPAEATILRIWDTGMTVNDDPVVGFLLDVHPREGESYQAETKLLVSRLEVPRIQPGTVVPVRYDPAQPMRVSLELGAPEAAPVPAQMPRAADLEPEKQRLLATGVAGTATILRCEPLGLFDADGRPAYDLMLEVVVPGQPAARGPVRTAVPKQRESWFRAGQKLPIKADPEIPTHFAVDWERLE